MFKGFRRAVSMILVLAFVFSVTTICSMAVAMPTSVKVSLDVVTNEITNEVTNEVVVSGTNPYGAGVRSAISVFYDTETTPYYFRAIESDANGNFRFEYNIDDNDRTGMYYVHIGGAALQSVTEDYLYVNKTDSDSIAALVSNVTTIADMQAKIETIKLTYNIDIISLNSFFAGIANQTDVYGGLLNRVYTSALGFIKAFDQAAAVQLLNETSLTDIEAAINIHAEVVGLDISETSRFAGISDKSPVYATMANTTLPTGDMAKVNEIFEKAIYLEMFNEISKGTIDKSVQYINECNSLSYTDISLDDYNSVLLTDVDRATILKDFLASKDNMKFSSLDNVKEVFELLAQNRVAAVIASKNEVQNSKPGNSGSSSVAITVTEKPTNDVIPSPPPVDNPPVVENITPVFDDMEDVQWAVESVNYLAQKGVIAGDGKGNFNPNIAVTREEFVKMVLLAFEVPVESTINTFGDVEKGQWYYDYVMRACASGLVTGIDYVNFGVGQPITREQMCVIIYRTMNLMDINLVSERTEMNFKDNDSISSYSYDAVKALYLAGVINGVGDDSMEPSGETTRAMAAKVIYSVMQGGKLK